MNGPFVLHLMGRAELRDAEGTRVELPTRRTLLLLAVLALDCDGKNRLDLARTVWQGASDQSARQGLRTALSALRRRLPDGAIVEEEDGLRLRPGAVVVSTDEDYPGDFMPGSDEDWAIDRRLTLRAEAVDGLLERSERAKSQEDALAAARRAAEIDPLDERVTHRLAELLQAQGRGVDAARVVRLRRSRALRELGVAPAVPVAGSTAEHPLVSAAEWSLAADPDGTCDLLAATHAHWLGMGVERAIAIHERALAVTSKRSSARRLVRATWVNLRVVAGQWNGDPIRLAGEVRRTWEAGEPEAARRLHEALVYRALSGGDFEKAVAEANAFAAQVGEGQKPEAEIASATTLAIVLQHVGRRAEALAYARRAFLLGESIGSGYTTASANVILGGLLLESSYVEEAADRYEAAAYAAETSGYERLRPWVLQLEARLREVTKDDEAAERSLERTRDYVADAGHAFAAMTDDAFARLYCRRGEYRKSAESLVRAGQGRRRVAAVPSLHERDLTRPIAQELRDRLSPSDLAAARRAAEG